MSGLKFLASNSSRLEPWRWRPSFAALSVGVLILVFYASVLAIVFGLIHKASSEKNATLELVSEPFIYSVKQASLTCLVCAFLGPLIAWALLVLRARRWQSLLVVPYALPSVAVGGMLVLCFGNHGVLNRLWQSLTGGSGDSIQFLYHDWSSLLGTVWMNLSLGVYLLQRRLESIPAEVKFEAHLLKLSRLAYFRTVALPYVFPVMLAWLAVVFLACFGSFGLMLMLSGSPAATTLELATWQALFVEGDWTKAALLMALQLVSCCVLVAGYLLLIRFSKETSHLEFTVHEGAQSRWYDSTPNPYEQVLAAIVAASFLIFYGLPIASMVYEVYADYAHNLAKFSSEFAQAAGFSVLNGFVSSFLMMSMVTLIVRARALSARFENHRLRLFFDISSWLGWVIPGMVVSFAVLSILIHAEAPIVKYLLLWFVQALQALPVVAALYASIWESKMSSHVRIQQELGLSSWIYFSRVEIPAMSKGFLLAFVFGASLSMSDVTVVSLLAPSENPPLTILISRLMASYQFAEASLAMVVLISLSAGAVLLATSRGSGRRWGDA